MGKGIFFTIDSLLASGIVILSVVLVSNFYFVEKERANINYASSDLISVFSSMKVGDINSDYVKNLTASGIITNINNTLIEQIGEFWAGEQTDLARNFTRNLTESLVPKRYGFGVYVNGDEIYARSGNATSSLISSRKLISGIAKAKPIDGFSSRAFLSKLTSKKVTKYYASDVIAPCYNSPGDSTNADKISIEQTIDLPNDANVTNATWVIVTAIGSTKVDAYVNQNKVFSGIPDDNGIQNLQGNFTSGTNKIKYNQTVKSSGGCPGDDGTSHLILTYKTQQLQTIDNKTALPFVVVYSDGRISDYEKPVFVPNTAISKINISLNLNASQVFLRFRLKATEFGIGNKTVVNKHVDFTNNDILNNLTSRGLSYNDLSDTFFYFIFDFRPQSNNVTILPNSTVTVEGQQSGIPFGYIDITQSVNLTGQGSPASSNFKGWCPGAYYNVNWSFNVPSNAVHLYSDWLITWCWISDADQVAKENSINLYRHIEGDASTDPFVSAFARFGYTKNTAAGSVVTGRNDFTLSFGSDYATRPLASYGESVFVIPNSVTYTSVLGQANGCTWQVKTQEAGVQTIKVPKDYSGANICAYNGNNITYSSNDSLQVAAYQIFKLLDFDNNGDLNILVSSSDVEIVTQVVSKVPSLWGPAVMEIRVWQ